MVCFEPFIISEIIRTTANLLEDKKQKSVLLEKKIVFACLFDDV